MVNNTLLKRKILYYIYNGYFFRTDYKKEKIIDNFDIVGGSQPPKSQFSDIKKDGYVRLYQTRDYGEKPVPVYVKKDTVSKFTKKGDILLARYGGSLGKVFIAEDGAYNVAMAKVCINDEERFYPKFVYYYFLSDFYQKFTKTLSKMAQAGFNKNDLSELEIIVPPYEEQIDAVNNIEKIFELIDQKERNDQEKEKLKSILKNKVLEDAIHGKLIENDLSLPVPEVDEINGENPFEIPSNWKWTTFDLLFNIVNGFTPLRTKKEYWDKQEVPWFTVEDIKKQGHIINKTSQYITKLALGNSGRIIPKDTVILCCTSATIGNYALAKIDMTTNQQWNGLLVKDKYKNDIYYKFIYYYVSTLKSKMISVGNSTTFPFISVKKLGKFLMPIPPIEEQKRIVTKIEELFNLIDSIA